jgi:hypothetical protein
MSKSRESALYKSPPQLPYYQGIEGRMFFSKFEHRQPFVGAWQCHAPTDLSNGGR